MHQTCLSNFFSRCNGGGGTADGVSSEGDVAASRTASPRTKVVSEESAPAGLKSSQDDEARVALGESRSSVPTDGLSWNMKQNSYYTVHAAECTTLLAGYPAPTATSMAKLFQDSSFDPIDTFQGVWAPPLHSPHRTAAAVEEVPFAAVVDVLADISATGPRLECVRLLTFLLLAVIERCPADLVSVIYLVLSKQAPQHEGVELGIGDGLLIKIVAECCGMTVARATQEYKQSGDLAEIAQHNKQKQSTLVKPRPLSARRVFNTYKDIALMSGKEVMRRRSDAIKCLLRDAQGPEVNLIIRGLQQKMRIGLAESSALAAIGYAFALHFLGRHMMHSMEAEALQLLLNTGAASFARIFYEVPSLEVVIQAVLDHGFMILVPGSRTAQQHAAELSIRPGLPVKPQLAHPTSGITMILDRFQGKRFTSEYKYDGERAQIHYQKGAGFQIFSRNSETHTGKYPDVISMLPQVFTGEEVSSFIIDSEVVAVHPDTGALQAFQVLQHRGRKNITEKDVTIPVCVFAFDLLYLNGEPQLNQTLLVRRQLLQKWFQPLAAKFAFATHLDSDNVEDVQQFLETSIADGCEGLMIKTTEEEATYTPAKRSHYWLKLKKDYMDGVTDTLDLVPIAAFYGKGKRTGVFGGFLLACYDAEADEYQSICKIGTGFQDEVLERITKTLKELTVEEKPRYYRAEEEGPDVWLAASQVWEIKAADLSISPVHYAAMGLVDPTRGVALRFPRFIREREDKKPVDATSAQQIAEIYNAQPLAMKREEEGKDAELEEDQLI